MKLSLASAFIIATIAAGAQEPKLRKACIKMESEENGKITRIDTCVTAATEAELQQKLKALNLPGLPVPPAPPNAPQAPQINIQVDSLPDDGYSYSYSKVISIDDGDPKEARKAGERRKTKIVTRSGGEAGAEVFIMDEEGNITHTGAGDSKVVVRTLKPGEKMDEELEKMLKEHGMENGKCEGKQIIIKSDAKNGKEKKDMKVFVFSKMEVKKLSEAERKKLPAEAGKALQAGRDFENLSVAPNPTEDACTISYKSVSKEPLLIKVYNEEGKTVMAETDTNTGDQVNKTLSLKSLGQGVYFVHISQGKQSEVRKVIVK
jgi:hypothetical protein